MYFLGLTTWDWFGIGLLGVFIVGAWALGSRARG